MGFMYLSAWKEHSNTDNLLVDWNRNTIQVQSTLVLWVRDGNRRYTYSLTHLMTPFTSRHFDVFVLASLGCIDNLFSTKL